MTMPNEINFAEFEVIQGGSVKVTPDGKVSGYLVTFSDESSTDLSGDFFTKDTDFGVHKTIPTLYNHGMDVKIGGKSIGVGEVTIDEDGVWFEAQLEQRDKYEKYVLKLARMGKLGWSSGTAPHLVKRERVGKANKIVSWPLGLDASLTPTPAEPRNTAYSMKSIEATDLELQIEPEGGEPVRSQSVNATDTKGKTMADEVKANENPAPPVDENSVASILDRVIEEKKNENATKARQAEERESMIAKMSEMVDLAMKNAPAVNGGASSPRYSIDSKKNESKAFWNYVRTGDRAPYLKANNDLTEGGGDAEGGAVVPPDFYNTIIQRRNEVSIARACGATVIQTSLVHVDVPVENADTEKFIAAAEKAAVTDSELAADPFVTKSILVKKFQKTIKVSEELIADQKANLEGWMGQYLGRSMGLTENEQFLVGTNPVGIVTEAGTGTSTANYSSVTAANVLALYYSLSQPYRDGAVWVMNPAIEAAIRALTGEQFSFGPTPQGAINTTNLSSLVGPNARVYNSSEMDGFGSEHKIALFGNWQYYMICERQGLSILRLNELYRGTGQIGFVANFRVGGAGTQTEAFKVLATPTNET
jgi:HK97 family phage major capsid protein